MPGFVDAVRFLRASTRVVALTGAGISTGSGIPDFRSRGGIWTRFDPSEFAYARFLDDPVAFWTLRAALMAELDLASKRPNAAHEALVRLESAGKLRGVVTQNIDGLHSLVGHSRDRVIELHGSADQVRCVPCDVFYPFSVARAHLATGTVPPPCPGCAGPMKPGTVLFGEPLPILELSRATALARSCDVLLVAGSSLEVYPAAGLPQVARDAGAAVIIANASTTPFDVEADAVVRGDLSHVLPRLVEAALAPAPP